jgi:mxaJ protein
MSVKNIPMRRCAALLIGLSLWTGALAEEAPAFRVCADPSNPPFSEKSGEGFENRIAEIWAEQLGLPIEYTWFPQRRGFVRKTLKAPDESGSGYKCDVVMGVAAGFDRLLTTKPYYRSTYALVYAKGRDLDGVASGQDLIDLDPEIRNRLRIGAFTPTPGAKWLARHGMNEQLVPFLAMSGDPEAYPGEIIEKELAEGRLDAAIVWGPIAGFYAKRSESAELVVVLMQSEPGIQFDFSISAGVRYGDGERKQLLEELMLKTAAPMQMVFAEYDVPLLDIASDAGPARVSDDD